MKLIKRNFLQLISLMMILALSNTTNALEPFEGLFLGTIPYQEDPSLDPLNYILGRKQDDNSIKQEKEVLMKYVGYYQEGQNLKNRCEFYSEPDFLNPYQKFQALRIMFNTYQYIGLDISLRAIVEYAKEYGLTESEFEKMTTNLVGNSCSKNLTTISRKEILNNFKYKFKFGSGFLLPETGANVLFPKDVLDSINTKQEVLNKEFKASIKLFQSFCSWGNDPDDPRLLEVFFKDHAFASFIIRKMIAKTIDFDTFKRVLFKKNSDEGVHISCQNHICRRSSIITFKRNFPRIIGSSNIENDLEKIYCYHIRDKKFSNNAPEKIKKIRNQTTMDEELFMHAHMQSLITGIPDFMLRTNSFKQADKVFKAHIQQTWNEWAKETSRIFTENLLYEESLALELVDRKYYFNPMKPEFSVDFKVTLGEFDRGLNAVDKITNSFNLKISNDVMRWFGTQVKNIGPLEKEQMKNLKQHFRNQIKDQITRLESRFVIKPWQGDIGEIIVNELLAQVNLYSGNYFNNYSKQTMTIPVRFHYGLFSLGYINYRLKRKHNSIILGKNVQAKDIK